MVALLPYSPTARIDHFLVADARIDDESINLRATWWVNARPVIPLFPSVYSIPLGHGI